MLVMVEGLVGKHVSTGELAGPGGGGDDDMGEGAQNGEGGDNNMGALQDVEGEGAQIGEGGVGDTGALQDVEGAQIGEGGVDDTGALQDDDGAHNPTVDGISIADVDLEMTQIVMYEDGDASQEDLNN